MWPLLSGFTLGVILTLLSRWHSALHQSGNLRPKSVASDARSITRPPPLLNGPVSGALSHPAWRLTEESRARINKTRVMCWVPSRHTSGTTIERIRSTWGPSCDLLIFTATESNPALNVVRIDYPKDRNLWNMIHPAWTYVAENYLEKFDWFFKIDDDTYFEVDNFRCFVQDKNPDDVGYFGHRTHLPRGGYPDDVNSFFNLGAGYGLSQKSLRVLEPFLPDSKKSLPQGQSTKCARTVTWAEDVEFRNCLTVAGIGVANDTRDNWKRENFMGFAPVDNIAAVRRPDSVSWFWFGKPRDTGSGTMCCSSRPVLWHGLKNDQGRYFFILDYFLHRLAVDPV